MMGSGKSVVGRLVADRIGLGVADTDAEIAARLGMSIEDVWRERGEDGFRLIEADAVECLSRGDAKVIATGGGAVLRDDNVAVMRRSGRVVWLLASPAALAARVGGGSGRPLLGGAPASSPQRTLACLFRARKHRYELAAHARVVTDGLEPHEVADLVVEVWEAAGDDSTGGG